MRTMIGAMFALVTAVSLFAHAVPVGASMQSQVAPNLTGTWQLNIPLSDKPPSAPDNAGSERRGRGRPGGAGGGMGGRGGGMDGRGEGEMPSREEMERQRTVMETAMRAPNRLILVESETGFVLTDEEGVSLRIPLDGQKETGAVNGVPFETTSKWGDGRLRLERKFKGGLKLVEQYSLSADGRQMTVTSKLEGGRMPEGARTTRRMYDRQERQ